MTGYSVKAHGIKAILRAGSTDLGITYPEWGAHIRSEITKDAQGWVQIPLEVESRDDGKTLLLKKVEVEYATGWKTIFDAVQVYMGHTKVMDKSDFGYSHDEVNKVVFDVHGSPHINGGIAISLLFIIPGGRDDGGRWATVASVGAYFTRE